MIGFYNYTVFLTYLGFACGVCGIYFAATAKTHAAILALLLAGLCDMFDGKIAKTKTDRTEQEKKFGIQIDSLSDMVCFGILPPMIAFSAGLHSAPQFAVLICFSLAALIRLAYFNVTEEERQQKTSETRKMYEGLPVTSTALLIPLLFCFRNDLGAAFPYVATVEYAMIGAAFLIRFRLKKPKLRAMLLFILIGALELLLLFIKFRSHQNA